jgi:uncharacterized protein YfkK (UPF0435 family)
MGSQESDRSVPSLWCGDFTYRYDMIGIYIHRKDSFISDEVIAYADELTKDIDA